MPATSGEGMLGGMTLRVLLVDDSDVFIARARRLLELEGLQVVATATTGAEAVQRALEHSPDVSLVDIDLGGESGFEVVRRLHEIGDDGSISILISSHYPEDFVDLVADSPAAGFLSKSRLSASAIRGVLAARGSDRPTA
jgi:two-component system nitrate/nitrite response regulator NarL